MRNAKRLANNGDDLADLDHFKNRTSERFRHIHGLTNGSLKQLSKNGFLGAQMMERLTQVTHDLEEIVEITQGKKPEKLFLNGASLVHMTPKKRAGALALLDAYRAIALMSLAQGRYTLTAYTIGKKIAAGFLPIMSEKLDEMLGKFGIRGVHCRKLSGEKVNVQIEHCVTARGVHDGKKPVCYFEAGLLSGLIEKILQKKIEIYESKCRAVGNPVCEFEILDPAKLDKDKDSQFVALLSGGYAEENLKLLMTLASHALTAIDNALLFEKTRRQVVIDGLTEIFNHRYFQEMVRIELRRSHRHHIPLSLIMIDIDHFKSFNDHHGHPKGDELLKHIASFLKQSIRDIDILARYGGDEFIIILPQTNSEGAVRVADRIRKSNFFARYHELGSHVKLGFTIGVNSTLGEKPVKPQKFIDDVDRALLKAKRRGKQRMGVVKSKNRFAFL